MVVGLRRLVPLPSQWERLGEGRRGAQAGLAPQGYSHGY